MSISVVIPLYNKAPHIERTLRSVLTQTSLPDEVIVVDDGSTDGGGEIVAALGDPLIRLIRQENQGVSAARNRGIDEARGELIAFLDADDAWKPKFLDIILNLQRKYPQAGIYATAYSVVFPDGSNPTRDFHVFSSGQSEGIIDNYFRVAGRFPVWTSALAVPKQVIEVVGGFQAGEVGEVMEEDVDLWLRIAFRYPIAWSSEPLAVYYKDAVNRSCRSYGFRRWSQEPIISKTARMAISEGLIPPDQVDDLREYAAHFQLAAAIDCLIQGKKDITRQLLGYSRGTKKSARQWWKWRVLAAFPGNSGAWLWKAKQLINNSQ